MWGNYTYNDTAMTLLMAGTSDTRLSVAANTCPDGGCSSALPPAAVDNSFNGTIYWSNVSIWNNTGESTLEAPARVPSPQPARGLTRLPAPRCPHSCGRLVQPSATAQPQCRFSAPLTQAPPPSPCAAPFRKPLAGDNVTIPQGWNLVIDENTAPVGRLNIQGIVSFDPTKAVTLSATYIMVTGEGVLLAGSRVAPHPVQATISLVGRRDTPDLALDNSLILGSKFLAALRGGTIQLYGRQVRGLAVGAASERKKERSTGGMRTHTPSVKYRVLYFLSFRRSEWAGAGSPRGLWGEPRAGCGAQGQKELRCTVRDARRCWSREPQVAKRWVKLGAAAAVGASNITLADGGHGWRLGDKIVVTTSSYSWKQAEIRNITSIQANGTVLGLDAPLQWSHAALLKSYPGSSVVVDMRAEVGLLSSNVLITASDGPASYANASDMFGARVVVSGNSTGRFEGVAIEYCGQAGLDDRACFLFDRLARVRNTTTANATGTVPNPSALVRSSVFRGMVSAPRTCSCASRSLCLAVLPGSLGFELRQG